MRTGHGFILGLIVRGLIVALVVFGLWETIPHPSHPAVGMHRYHIGIAAGTGRALLFDGHGTPFVPVGANYLVMDPTTHQGITFDPGVYDAARTDTTFATMQAYGYTTVRLFVWPAKLGNRTGVGLDGTALANLADALARADAHGLAPILTVTGLPPTAGYTPPVRDRRYLGTQVSMPGRTPSGGRGDAPPEYSSNWLYLTPEALATRRRYLTDLLTGLIAHDANLTRVLAYDLTGEMAFVTRDYPLSLAGGRVTTKTGTYEMGDAGQRSAMMDNDLVAYVDGLVDAVKAVDPHALTLIQEAPQATNPDPGTYEYRSAATMTASHADLLGLSLYPTFAVSLAAEMASFGVSVRTITKPMLMLETGWLATALTGPPSVTLADLAARSLAWEREACRYGVAGALWFTWDTPARLTGYYPATSGGDVFAAALAPSVVGDLCQEGRPLP